MSDRNLHSSTSHSASDAQSTGVAIGILTGIDTTGQPLVAFAGNASDLPVPVKSTVTVVPEAIGSEVALLFEGGDMSCPILIGVVQSHVASPPVQQVAGTRRDDSDADSPRRRIAPTETSDVSDAAESTKSPELLVDGERVQVIAEREMVLRCGKASITLTRAGKVIIRGAYISTLSSGANRIKGGSVQIN